MFYKIYENQLFDDLPFFSINIDFETGNLIGIDSFYKTTDSEGLNIEDIFREERYSLKYVYNDFSMNDYKLMQIPPMSDIDKTYSDTYSFYTIDNLGIVINSSILLSFPYDVFESWEKKIMH